MVYNWNSIINCLRALNLEWLVLISKDDHPFNVYQPVIINAAEYTQQLPINFISWSYMTFYI